ncbi:lipopolysaccharide biosynthesis protein [Allobranchiibius sp. GilTou38]|uniref:lipopolysaccharide biosynthesis protein n=1 Tax=Allobranchiibius sp. GilTou38 TaxID=2815210 RepID=UPI0032619848
MTGVSELPPPEVDEEEGGDYETRVPSQGLGERAARGAIVTVGGQVVRILIQMAGVVALARILSPRDYGLLAMVVAIVGVAEIFRDFGLSYAAVQARTLSAGQRTNLFWINTGLGGSLTVVIIAGAPLIALIYGQPELRRIAMVLSFVFLFDGLATQYRADLNRNMRFGVLAATDVVSVMLAAALAVLLAVWGAGYWALVAQQLGQAVIGLMIVVGVSRWIPGKPSRHEPMRHLLRFGWHYVSAQLIQYVGSNADSFIIGTRFGARPLGLYNRGFQLLMAPLGQVRSPTTSVALPVLSRLRDDSVRHDRYVLRGQLALGYLLVLPIAFLAGAARPVIVLVLGDRWSGVVPIFRMLAVAGAVQTFSFACFWIYLSREITGQLVKLSYVETGIRIACLVIGSRWGVVGVATGYAVSAAIKWPFSLWFAARKTQCPVRAMVRDATRVTAMAVLCGAAGFVTCSVVPLAPLTQILLSACACVAAIAGAAALAPAVRRDVEDIVHTVQSVVRRKGKLAQ